MRLGYSVIISPDGDDAIEKYQEAMDSESPVSAAILDLTIPGGLGGKDTM